MLSYGKFYSNNGHQLLLTRFQMEMVARAIHHKDSNCLTEILFYDFMFVHLEWNFFFAPSFGCYMGSCMFSHTLYIVDSVLAFVSIWVVIFNSRIISCINSKLSAGCHAMPHKTVFSSSWPSYSLDEWLSFCTKCKIQLELPFG